MKKLMIATAIVCAAVFAHGAQFYWGVNNSFNMGPGTEADGYVDGDGYLLDGFATLIVAGETIATAPSINGDFTFGSPVDLVTDTSGVLSALPSGTIEYEPKAFQIILTTLDGKYQSVIEDVSYFETQFVSVDDPNLNYEAFVTTKAAGEWTSTSGGVPEPTSGLLLLIGMAGLALKRKIA